MSRRRRSRLAESVAPVVITADGMAFCTVCGWEPESDSDYMPLLVIWAREHIAYPSNCAEILERREAAKRRHPAGRARKPTNSVGNPRAPADGS